MPRIRSIKPEFWQDQKLSRMSALARLVYVCLWSMADDEGRMEADDETVWHFGFPREDRGEVAKALRMLAEASRIVRYRGDGGTELIAIPRWRVHQKIDKPSPSKLPAPPVVTTDSVITRGDSSSVRESSTTDRDQGSGIREGIKEQGTGSGEGADAPAPAAPARRKTDPLVLRLKTKLGSNANPCAAQIRALRGAGWDDARIEAAIAAHAEPGMAPWDWTKKARGAVSPTPRSFADERIDRLLDGMPSLTNGRVHHD